MPKVPKKVEKAIKEFINRNKKHITKPNKRNYFIWFLRKRGLQRKFRCGYYDTNEII